MTPTTAEPKARRQIKRLPSAPSGVTVVGSKLRSTNLERDVYSDDLLPPLYIGARIQDALDRLVGALEDPARTRAWSLTGPYGTGKSTLALLMSTLLDTDSPRRRHADDTVAEYNPTLTARLTAAREHASPDGFLITVATARREPLTQTLRRALAHAVNLRWPEAKPPKDVSAALSALTKAGSGPTELLAATAALCRHSPVLLIIDEFGKTLEYLATTDADHSLDDLFLLQELAEKGAGKKGLPLFLITLQHLSFLDYASRSATLQKREWAKVQGRFEDITFTTHIGDALQLLRRSLDHSAVSTAGRKLLAAHQTASAAAWSEHGLDGVITPDETLFADLYPLHPLTAAAAPLLASQVGQNDRSVSGFLSGDEPNSVARFLATSSRRNATHASTIQLPQLYDYFLASGRTTILVSANASRWIEIDSRISEAHGLSDTELRILKTVGLLNLIDSSGALRASAHMVLFALTDPASGDNDGATEALHSTLKDLQERGFLVYREFSDEYRVWQGTDVDLQSRIDEIWDRCDDHAVVGVLRRHLPEAIVAGRHSQRTGMLRHFVTTISEHTTGSVVGPAPGGSADGLMVFHLGDHDDLPQVQTSLPVVAGITKHARAVLDAGRHLFCLETLREDASLDAVARREVGERISQATAEVATILAQAFSPIETDAQWLLRQAEGDELLQARSLSGIVSAACEHVYPLTPHVRNEMLGRHTLTSQAAKARRELLTAMIDHPHEQYLGIEGFGPERAMYSGVLEYMGLHALISDGTQHHSRGLVPYGYTEPDSTNPVHPAWTTLSDALSNATKQTSLETISQSLNAAPYGVKAGVVPVLVIAALLLRSEDVALFEEGNYRTRLTADAMERMLKSPGRFTVKTAPTSKGQRKLVLDLLSDVLGASTPKPARQTRNPMVLTITQALLNRVRSLTPYARRTRLISTDAQAVRTALTTSADPVDLIFATLPRALNQPEIGARAGRDEKSARAYVEKLAAALDEITSASSVLRDSAVSAIAEAFRLPSGLPALRQELRDRARGFGNASLEPQLRGLITIAANETLSDDDWLDPLIVRINGVPLSEWTDNDAQAFSRLTKQLALALDRVSHLYENDAERGIDDGYKAQLVTVTTPEGTESRTLVRTSAAARADAATLAREVLARATTELGPDGGRILLAALTEELLAADFTTGQLDTTGAQ
ncbi:hypothetical protein [Nocardia jiangsuensis]|uniref:AAA ATPase-like protein n=1 Tax=Nocardia jiangsuensis TaxID=1691563 RepID=A0ABV8DNL3_9NOCA